MSSIEKLAAAYESFIRLPWDPGAAGEQRILLAIYAPNEERRLRARIGAFENATATAGRQWKHVDLTSEFALWLAASDYREAYFEEPADLEPALDEFAAVLQERVRAALNEPDAGSDTVVALTGVASLFGVARVSRLLHEVAGAIRGRLLVLFPGERDGPNYRLLDARDGYNYRAIPIVAEED